MINKYLTNTNETEKKNRISINSVNKRIYYYYSRKRNKKEKLKLPYHPKQSKIQKMSQSQAKKQQ